jgi:hypothetical protein
MEPVQMPPFPSPVELMADQLRRMRVSIVTGVPADAISPALQRWEQQVLDLMLPL